MKTKLLIILISILSFNGEANNETLKGYWTGSIKLHGKMVDLTVVINSENNTFSSKDLMLVEQPLSNLEIKNDSVYFSLILDVELFFKGALSPKGIRGTINMVNGPPQMKMEFKLIKQDIIPYKPYDVENISIVSDRVVLSASYFKQKGKRKYPAIVLLQGSSTNLKSDYIFDADFFAKRGFEVLIFDKRGNGESTGEYLPSTYNDLINDAIACLKYMKTQKSVDTNKIGLWGYSQGASLLPKIISKTDIPAFLIAKSPEVISVTEAAAFSDSLRVIQFGYSKTEGHIVAESHREIERMILNNTNHQDLQVYIHQNAREFPFMNQTGLYGSLDIDKSEYKGFYWSGRTEIFLNYWQNVSIPTIVLFGERDALINTKKNEQILRSFNNEFLEIHVFGKANHHLKNTYNPAIDKEFDFPRLVEKYSKVIDLWIEEKIQ